MSNQDGSLHHTSSPFTPASQLDLGSPTQQSDTPLTPPSNRHPHEKDFVPGSDSPFEAPNDKRRKSSGKPRAQAVLPENEQSLVDALHDYHRRQFEMKEKALLDRISKLQIENVSLNHRVSEQAKKIATGPDHEYLVAVESECKALDAQVQEWKNKYDALKISEQNLGVEVQRLTFDLEELQQDVNTSQTIAYENSIRKQEFGDQELYEELRQTKEDYASLYDNCVRLQQEKDDLASMSRDYVTMAAKLKDLEVKNNSSPIEEELHKLRMLLMQVQDRLDPEIESRMAKEGSMFEDYATFDHQLELKDQELKELKRLLRSQQEENEHQRNAEMDRDRSLTRSKSLQDEFAIQMSSFEEEMRTHTDGKYADQHNDARAGIYSTGSSLHIQQNENMQHGKVQPLWMEQNIVNRILHPSNIETKHQGICKQLQNLLEECNLQSSVAANDDESSNARNLLENICDMLKDYGLTVEPCNERSNGHPKDQNISFMAGQNVQTFGPSKTSPSKEIAKLTVSQQDLSISHEDVVVHNETIGKTWHEQLASIWQGVLEGFPDFLDEYQTHISEGITDDNEDLLNPFVGGLMDAKRGKPPQVMEISFVAPSPSMKIWTEMIGFGRTCWTEIAIKDRDIALNSRTVWIKIQVPRWWQIIIGLLLLLLVLGNSWAWWCINATNQERDLWMEANEISYQKYWDTSVWGAERGFLWKLWYGLGYV